MFELQVSESSQAMDCIGEVCAWADSSLSLITEPESVVIADVLSTFV